MLSHDLWARRIAPCYLLTGHEVDVVNRIAKAFAQALLCATPQTTSPSIPHDGCCDCTECRKLALDAHPRCLFVPIKKPETGTEEIQQALTFLYKARIERGNTVLVIVHADHMNRIAQDMLLKALEEPPKGSTIMLTARTTSLKATLLSRCKKAHISPPYTPPRAINNNQAAPMADHTSSTDGLAPVTTMINKKENISGDILASLLGAQHNRQQVQNVIGTLCTESANALQHIECHEDIEPLVQTAEHLLHVYDKISHGANMRLVTLDFFLQETKYGEKHV